MLIVLSSAIILQHRDKKQYVIRHEERWNYKYLKQFLVQSTNILPLDTFGF